MEEQMQKLKEAKTNTEKVEAISEILREEARDIIKIANKDLTTQNGYGKIMPFMSQIGENGANGKLYQKAFCLSLEKEGYNLGTLETLKEIYSIA